MAPSAKPSTKPSAKPKAGPRAKPPSASDLAAALGIKLTRRLAGDQVNRLRKALPGYVSHLDDAARLLEAEEAFSVPGVTPDALHASYAELEHLTAREAAAEAVHRSVYEQRLQADDRAMGMLQKLVRRVEALAEDDPDLRVRWKRILDFMKQFRGGGGRKPAGGDKGGG